MNSKSNNLMNGLQELLSVTILLLIYVCLCLENKPDLVHFKQIMSY